MGYYLGVDLGGTNIAVGVVNENKKIVGQGKLKTNAPRPVEEIAKTIHEACRLAVADAGVSMDEIISVGVGSPGIIDRETGVIEYASNLGFIDTPFKEVVEREICKPIYLGNDADSAAYAEVVAGAAVGCNYVTALTLGTGVGGSIIINKKIYNGFNNAGGELGHVGMLYGGAECSCHMKGCVESYCSATALIRQTKEKMKEFPDSAMWRLCDGDIEKASGRTAFNAMREGDSAGKAVVDQFTSYLSYAVNNLINTFQPEVVLIGGGISKEGDTLLNPVREYCRSVSFVKNPNKQTRIVNTELGNDAGIIGAAFLFMA